MKEAIYCLNQLSFCNEEKALGREALQQDEDTKACLVEVLCSALPQLLCAAQPRQAAQLLKAVLHGIRALVGAFAQAASTESGYEELVDQAVSALRVLADVALRLSAQCSTAGEQH